MIDYSDERWTQLKGGYKIPYNPVEVLKKLQTAQNVRESWDTLCENTYHQGDIGDATYASLAKLVEIYEAHGQATLDFYIFAGMVELARQNKRNPEVPEWLKNDYKDALDRLFKLALTDLEQTEEKDLIRVVLGVLALLKKQPALGSLLAESGQDEIREILNERWGQDSLFEPSREI